MEWVKVEDRLPKDENNNIYCLVYDTYSGIIVRPYNQAHNCWDGEDADDHYTEAVGGTITHWQPLPERPTK